MADEGAKGKGSMSVGERMANMTQTSYVAPEEWATSSHGAYYILAPMQEVPADEASAAGNPRLTFHKRRLQEMSHSWCMTSCTR